MLSEKVGFELGIVRSYFKGNSKALAELESDGLMKLLFRKDNGEVLGAHIYGLHAADLIQEVSNALARRLSVSELAMPKNSCCSFSDSFSPSSYSVSM